MNEENKPQENKSDLTASLHTLEGDLLNSMKEENYSNNIVKIVTHDQTGLTGKVSTDSLASKFSDNPNYKKYLINTVALLFGVGSFAFYIMNLPESTKPAESEDVPKTVATTTLQAIQQETIFEADVVIPLEIANGTKLDLVRNVAVAEEGLLKNKIADKTNISFVSDANVETFFNKLQYSGPESLLRALSENQAYNFGVYHIKGPTFEKYILLKVSIFDLAFSGALEWERNMPIDLGALFTIPFVPTIASTTASSTSKIVIATTSLPATPKFVDKVIKNIDTRTYTDTVKGTTVTYGFINREYLLITSGESSFADIVNILLVKRVLR